MKNLMTAGMLRPAEWPLAQVRQQVAELLGLAPDRIDRLECWPHQLWVNIVGVGARFISYRRLPLWTESCVAIIKRCGYAWDAVDAAQTELQHLRQLLRAEVQQYRQHYAPDALEQLQQEWGQQYQYLQQLADQQAAEKERLKPWRDRLQVAQNWHDMWLQMLNHCHSTRDLDYLVPVFQGQSAAFQDVPQAAQLVVNHWNQRWTQLNQAAMQAQAAQPVATAGGMTA